MPAFVVEFDSNYGPERRLFTLDSDRQLRPQMIQVLEELRLADRILVGGPEDELGVYWNGEELDQMLALESLGVTTNRPLVLRMRPRKAAPVTARTINWYAILRPPLEGAIGALIAWFASSYMIDLRLPLRSADDVDVVVTAMLAAGIGVALAIGCLARRETSFGGALPVMLLSPVAAAATLLAIATLGASPTVGAFFGSRILAWVLGMAMLSLLVASTRRSLPSTRWMSALGFGAVSGAICAIVMSLPGPSLLWQGLSFLIAGLGVGFSALAYPAWRSATALVSAQVSAS
jgi:hypothetical protein